MTPLCLQEIRIVLQSLRLIDFDLLIQSVTECLSAVLAAMCSMFKTSAQLRLENVVLRQQLGVLRRSGTQAPEADACRPNLLGICAGFVAQLEIRAHDCQA
jgi:hypothetical protein